MILLKLVHNEMIKIIGKKRSLIGFIAIGILMPVIMFAFGYNQSGFSSEFSHHAANIGGGLIMVGTPVNGYFITHMIMNFLWVHIPFLITLVAGDVVAGEGAAGTLRIYLTRPVSRLKIIFSKLISACLYTAAIILFFALLSLSLGIIWHGTGDLIVIHRGILILSSDMVPWRFVLSFTFAIFVMWVVTSLTFMFSSMVNNGIGPMIGAMAVIIISLALSTIPLEIFETIRPYLFTTYFDVWKKAFYDPIPWDEIAVSLGILAGYMAGFIIIAFSIFIRKDILT
ncbi:MAG: ABC transporter permease [Fidelibacterota bacterium]